MGERFKLYDINSIELGSLGYERKRKYTWWKRINWKKFMMYTGIILFIYDVSYCVVLYFYVRALNVNQSLRLLVYKKNYMFMLVYYSLHHFLGDPTLQESDVTQWHEEGEL